MTLSPWQTKPLEYILSNTEFLALGIVTLIFVGVTLLISGKMIYRGIRIKNKLIAYVGISYFGLASCWFGVALNFLSVLIFRVIPPWELYFLAHGGIVTIALVFWITAMSELLMLKEKTRKKVIIVSVILASITEIIYIIIIFTETDLLGIPKAPIQVVYEPFSYVYLMTDLMIFLCFGFYFVRESLAANEPTIRLKGKFLGASFMIFTMGSILEVFVQEIWIFVIARIIIMSSAVLFYIGFLMPSKIEKALLK